MARRRPGQGSVFYRRDRKVWIAQIEHDGRIIQRSAPTKADADDLLATLLKSARQAGAVPDAKLTVTAYLDLWLEQRADLAEGSRRVYHNHFARLTPFLGDTKIGKLRATDILRLWRDLRAYRDGKGRPFSPATAAATVATLKTALADAVRWGLLAFNPAGMVKAPVSSDPVWQRKPKPVILTPVELRALLAVCEHAQEGPLVGLIATTGLRISEALALHWADYDGHTIRVWCAVHMEAGGPAIGKMKTPRSIRTLPVPAVTAALLDVQREYVTLIRADAGDSWQDQDLIFPGLRGQYRNSANLMKHVRHICAEAGVPTLTWHALRHTLASVMAAEGVSLMAISRTLGHARIDTTVDIYGTTAPGLLEQVTRQVDAILPVVTPRLLSQTGNETGNSAK